MLCLLPVIKKTINMYCWYNWKRNITLLWVTCR